MFKTISALALTVIISAGASCTVPPPDYPPPDTTESTTTTEASTTTTTLPPTSGNRYVLGASISAQAVSTTVTNGDGRTWDAIPGAVLETHRTLLETALAEPASTIILADIAANEAATYTYGWTPEDEANWADALDRAAPNTCVILVLPWATEKLDDYYPGMRAEIDKARVWLAAQAGRPNVVVTDWKTYVDQNPEMIIDGLHIAAFGYDPNNMAAYAWLQMMNYAEDSCPVV